MRLVIDIPDRDYNDIMTNNGYSPVQLANVIKNGKPLDISEEDAVERFKKEIESGFYIDHATSPFKVTTTDIDYGG